MYMDALYETFEKIACICNLPYVLTSFSYLTFQKMNKDFYVCDRDFLHNFLRIWLECKKHRIFLHIHSINDLPTIGWYKLSFIGEEEDTSVNIYMIRRNSIDRRWYLVNEIARDMCPKKYLSDSEISYNP